MFGPCSPVARSGLAALPIRPTVMKTMMSFHHKILRGILKLSPVSPIVPLYFLLGQLPIEASLHIDLLTLFWCVWANPQTKIHQIVKYLLMMSDSSSLTWSAHLRLLFQMYNLPDPLALMHGDLWPKERWKMVLKKSVVSYHEFDLRRKSLTNSKLEFLNVQATGLSGRPHPVLSGIFNSQEVQRSRVHLKMLSGDYPCSSYLGNQETRILPVNSASHSSPSTLLLQKTWSMSLLCVGLLGTPGQR